MPAEDLLTTEITQMARRSIERYPLEPIARKLPFTQSQRSIRVSDLSQPSADSNFVNGFLERLNQYQVKPTNTGHCNLLKHRSTMSLTVPSNHQVGSSNISTPSHSGRKEFVSSPVASIFGLHERPLR